MGVESREIEVRHLGHLVNPIDQLEAGSKVDRWILILLPKSAEFSRLVNSQIRHNRLSPQVDLCDVPIVWDLLLAQRPHRLLDQYLLYSGPLCIGERPC